MIVENTSWDTNLITSLGYVFRSEIAEPENKHILKFEPYCPTGFQPTIDS